MELQESFGELKKLLLGLFTADPINWLKWGIVFAVLVMGYVVFLPLTQKVRYHFSWERKRDIAKSRGHVIKASLLEEHPSGEIGHYNWHAAYLYTLDGAQKKYRAYFNHPNTPPRILYLYYLHDPGKLFSVSEYHWDAPLGILLALMTFLPWLLAALAIYLLKIDISGF